MRYSTAENISLVGEFNPGDTVTIKIVDVMTDMVISTTDNLCYESRHIPGLFIFRTDKLNKTAIGAYSNLIYEMTNEQGDIYRGKVVFGGYPDNPVVVNIDYDKEDHDQIIELLTIINGRI